ncbi:Basal-body rod modification protein FlgD [bacterium HR37]|jgi:flagellar basal-body rod modification protein FlgD|nr:Basal-body rod modification protein FlgD [bacterium HR37]
MEIPGVDINPSQVQTNSKKLSPSDISQDEFLTLLITQLRFQDPLNPINNAEFTSQLAQLSSLEKLNNIDSQLRDLLIYQNSLQNTLAVSLMGREVEALGDEVYLKDQAEINYTLSQNASVVKISIYDLNGKLVREVELKGQPSGSNTYVWDGKSSTGEKLPEGRYVFTVSAFDAQGQAIDVTTTIKGVITGITFEDNITYLIIDDAIKVQLGDIKTIKTVNEGGV